jgi:acyl-CoA synthetase (NDP forming)
MVAEGLTARRIHYHECRRLREPWKVRRIGAIMVEAPEAVSERRLVTEVAAKELLRAQGIPVVPTSLARSPSEAVRVAKALGLPVALKIVSPDVVHKSEVGGVRLQLTSLAQVSNAYGEIVATVRARAPEAVIEGVSVQPMAKPGIEVVAGLTHDRTFGPVVMFGLGGIFVEILNDVAFRVVPLRPRDAHAMVREVRGFPTLQGFRGVPAVDLGALEDILLKLSGLAEQRSEFHEIDLNPIFAYPTGALAVDARILLT